MTGTELASPDQIASLPAERREQAVSAYLSIARDRLAMALEATGPHAVALIKAELATVAEATKQLGLSKEIRDDAAEMVRRAEYALGKAIRKGQEAGEVQTRGDNRHTLEPVDNQFIKHPVTEFASYGELTGNGAGIYHLTDGVSDEQFDDALAEARDEGNLSRANMVRKIKGVPQPGAERIHSGTKSVNSSAAKQRGVFERSITHLSGIAVGLAAVTELHPEITNEEAGRWAADLSKTVASLRRVVRLLEGA